MNKKKDNTYPLRLRAGEDPRIAEFLNLQSGGYGDVLRYLIEKEIALNGVRDLTLIIPSRRNIDVLAATDTNKVATSLKKTDFDKKKVEIAVAEEKSELEEQKDEVNISKKIKMDDENTEDEEDEIPSCYI